MLIGVCISVIDWDPRAFWKERCWIPAGKVMTCSRHSVITSRLLRLKPRKQETDYYSLAFSCALQLIIAYLSEMWFQLVVFINDIQVCDLLIEFWVF